MCSLLYCHIICLGNFIYLQNLYFLGMPFDSVLLDILWKMDYLQPARRKGQS